MTTDAPTDAELAASLDGDFTSAHADVGGTRLHYVIGGAGEPLVLLGGWPHTWWEFHKIMPELARRYQVITVDLRGQGGSAKPYDGYDKKTMADDIHGLARSLGHDRVNIAGHDIGAMVGYAFAANHPSSIRRLALLDVPHPDETLLERRLLPPQQDWQDSGATYQWWFAFNQVRGLPEELLAGRGRLIVDWMAGYHLVDQTSIPEFDRAVYARAYDSKDAIRAGNGWYQTFRQDVADFQTYKPVDTPLLALASTRTHQRFERVLPAHGTDTRLVLIDNSGHYLAEEQPAATARELIGFFE